MSGLSKKKSSTSKSSTKTAAKRAPRSLSKSPTKTAATRKKAATKRTALPRKAAAKKKAAPATRSVSAETAPPRAIPETTRQMVAAAAAACDEKKAEDTRILELDALDSGFTDFFLITSGTNERQTQSIADEVEMRLKRDFQTYPNSVEGKRQGEWILLDYVDFVVHVFLAEKRAFYDIERLRKSAKTVDVAELQNALKQKTAASRKRVAAKQSSSL